VLLAFQDKINVIDVLGNPAAVFEKCLEVRFWVDEELVAGTLELCH
jgi:hypothetical protein